MQAERHLFDRSRDNKLGFKNFFGESQLANYLSNDGSLVLRTSISVISDYEQQVQVKFDVNQAPMTDVPAAAVKMAEMLKSGSFCDCHFVCNDNSVVKSHKILLAARSPVLERLGYVFLIEYRRVLLEAIRHWFLNSILLKFEVFP